LLLRVYPPLDAEAHIPNPARDLPENRPIREHPLNRRTMPRRISPVRLAAIPLAAMIAACAQPSSVRTGPSPSPTPAGPTKPVRAGHPGFDTNVYPGDATMRAWRDASPYEWVGYYLPAPCHRDASWAGKREALIGMGWGTAAIYVGQQDWTQMNRAPAQQPQLDTAAAAQNPSTQPTPTPQSQPQPSGQPQPSTQTQVQAAPAQCSAANLVGGRGGTDADDAIARAAGEGFPAGSVIFLDVERVQNVSPQLVGYAREWAQRVLAEGRYLPGLYVHRLNAAPLAEAMRTAWVGAGRSDAVPVWVTATDAAFTLDQQPGASGLGDATMWQGRLDANESWGGTTLRIDQNVSLSRSPSAPR
jgi:hypothetical protein